LNGVRAGAPPWTTPYGPHRARLTSAPPRATAPLTGGACRDRL